jgi:hypothetical protein
MSQRSDISASIQQNFPDNSAQFITPTRLRSEQGLFEQYSVLNEQTASIIAQAVASASAAPVDSGSFATTGSNQFNGNQSISGSITTNGNLSFTTNTFVANYNETGSFFISALNDSTLYLNSDGGEGDVQIGYNGWNKKVKVKGNV